MVQRDPRLQTDRVTPALLGYIVQKIVRHLAPDQIILFGSRARGEAEREMQYEAPAYHTVCFLCQSAAEKYLKGYLVAQGWVLKKTHDITELLELCTEYAPDFEELLQEGSVLNEYITEGRYPGDIAFESVGNAEAQEARRSHVASEGQSLLNCQ